MGQHLQFGVSCNWGNSVWGFSGAGPVLPYCQRYKILYFPPCIPLSLSHFPCICFVLLGLIVGTAVG